MAMGRLLSFLLLFILVCAIHANAYTSDKKKGEIQTYCLKNKAFKSKKSGFRSVLKIISMKKQELQEYESNDDSLTEDYECDETMNFLSGYNIGFKGIYLQKMIYFGYSFLYLQDHHQNLFSPPRLKSL